MIRVVDYLLNELKKLGIKHIFGLPGDFNFNILTAIENTKEIEWIGCTNELNAGYAADGYARINGYGALVTTYGVGELSAVNAIAGSYAENIPVIKITGIPDTSFIKENVLLHHNFIEPDYYTGRNIYSNITKANAYLDENNAKSEIDRVLSVFINEKKPVYIAIPENICNLEIDESSPEIKIQTKDEENLNCAVKHILKVLEKSQQPVIIADILIDRFCANIEAKKFIEISGYPVTTFLMSKGLIDWEYKNFIGTYLGRFYNETVYQYVNKSDCIISIGTIYSDFNTFNFDIKFRPDNHIIVMNDYTIVENIRYENVLMKDILTLLSKMVPKKEFGLSIEPEKLIVPESESNTKLTLDYICARFQEFLKPYDILFTDTGIMNLGVAPLKLPFGARLYNQLLWGSIGWATPAAFGANMANENKRVILFTGEGSHQLTAQAVSTMLRNKLRPVIIVLNNSGYTIERVLSGQPENTFNDIASWDYSKLPLVFAGDVWTAKAYDEKEFDNILLQAEEIQKIKMCYIEIFADKMDLPILIRRRMESQ